MTVGLFVLTACSGNGAGIPDGTPAEDAGTETEPENTENEPETVWTVGETGDFAGLEKALAFVREERANGNTDPVTIRLYAGEYYFDQTVVIDETTPDITIEAYGDGEVRLIGGYKLTDFVPDTFNGYACLSAPVRDTDFTDFYVNGERADMTYKVMKFGETENGGEVFNNGSSWFITNSQFDKFTRLEKAYISVNTRWNDEHMKIDSYDPGTKRVTMDRSTRRFIYKDYPFKIENVPELFKRANDWYAADGRVYYIPRDDSITPETIEAYVPTVERLIEVRGTAEKPVTGVTLRGLTMAVSRGEYDAREGDSLIGCDNQSWWKMPGFVQMSFASSCRIENCRFTEYGLYGLVLEQGSREITVSCCDFYDGGSGGIKMRGGMGEDPVYAVEYNTVSDCTVLHCDRRYNAGCGILMIYTSHNVIEHNEIADLFYSGISCGWGWNVENQLTHDNLITKNHVHDIGQNTLSDLGAIYTLSSQPGTVISGNLIHDISYAEYGSRAFALDQGSSYLTIENNICYNCETGAIGSSIGVGNIARNNILCSGDELVYGSSVYEGQPSLTLEHNIIVTKGVPVMELWRDDLALGPVKASDNLYWDEKGEEIIAASLLKETTLTMEELRDQYGLEEGTIVADPGFADYENHDFTLAEDSPAFDIGFVPFDLSDVGPRR